MPKQGLFPRLRHIRVLRGYSQKDMTRLLEYKSMSRYAQYELGDRIPSVLEALRIARVLGETVEYLFVAVERPVACDEPNEHG